MKKSTVIVAIILAVIVIAGAALYLIFRPKTEEGAKTITIEIISEKDSYNFSKQYKTDEEYLGDFLVLKELITYEDSTYGRFISAASGIEQDSENNYFWAVYEDGVQTTVGMDDVVLKDGSVYSIVLEQYTY